MAKFGKFTFPHQNWVCELSPAGKNSYVVNIDYREPKNLRSGLRRGFGQGLGLGFGIAVVVAGVLIAQSLNTFSAGDLISAQQVNANFTALNTKIDTQIAALSPLMAPVGSIVAFHKHVENPGSAVNPLAVPAGWVECNGGTVSDADSPIDGFAIPDLNNTGRFLRGSTTTGTDQNDAFQGHHHTMSKDSNILEWYQTFPGGANCVPAGNCDSPRHGTTVTGHYSQDPITGNHGAVNALTETRPDNMSVVWIMRIK